MHATSTTAHVADLNANARRQAINSWKFQDEGDMVASLLAAAPYDEKQASQITNDAARLVEIARSDEANRALLDTFLTEYGLSNQEGIALMCLAESLLRIPDQRTAERLIADKIRLADWASHAGQADSLLVNASTWALMLGSKMVVEDRAFNTNPGRWLHQLTARLSEPVIEKAMRSAMLILGREFVLGTTIDKALRNSASDDAYSYDMLGEAAREAPTAARYFESYLKAIEAIGAGIKSGSASPASSISIKLSALHPRYEFSQRERVLDEVVPAVRLLCNAAEKACIELTIDAEEQDRLELSLEVFEQLARDPDLAEFDRLGLVVQAYGKRARPVLEWLVALARETGRRVPVRLVKGAYWDAEIKHAQVHGYSGYPVYTRKPTTDLSYLVCAKLILDHPQELYGQFATHNAQTISAVMHLAPVTESFEFQRLHGMGETLYTAARSHFAEFPRVRTYAPVGSHDDLLAYLVRRLLENGANSSFVNRFLDEALEPRALAQDPAQLVAETTPAGHPGIPLPGDIFGNQRRNSSGTDLTDLAEIATLNDAYRESENRQFRAASLVWGKASGGSGHAVMNPAFVDQRVGEQVPLSPHLIDRAFTLASREQQPWDEIGGSARAAAIEAVGDSLEANKSHFISLLAREAGKTIPDAIDEVREAVDFCRYYARQARSRFNGSDALPSPTGESNELSLHGRGVFVCISPWNFPLAIFVGQVTAALCAGNTVVAKPAEETPIVAFEAVRLMHKCGLPANACQLIVGDGNIGDQLVRHPLAAGVAFTGSTGTARKINLAMAETERPIAPLIAETGGQNAMVVDSSALLEQVTDDVVHSAFKSAGQRCSALRVLFLQDDIADKAIEMIRGAMDELQVGDPRELATDVGPIISESAAGELLGHIDRLKAEDCLVHECVLPAACKKGSFVSPTMFEVGSIDEIGGERFGPILHVIRYKGKDFEKTLSNIASSGFGLTFGIHTRIESRIKLAARSASVGNVYANRNITGAVVGSQPFGGRGLSGTGPKAGGPNYLLRFATERVVTINTVATGGNAELLNLQGEQRRL